MRNIQVEKTQELKLRLMQQNKYQQQRYFYTGLGGN